MSRNTGATTPARMTRSRSKTPLPGIAPRQSHAYGAQGKTDIRAQVRATGTDFSQEFQTTRQISNRGSSMAPSAGDEEDEEEVVAPVRASPAKLQGPRERRGQVPYQPTIPEEDEEPAIPPRNPTALDTSATYNGGNGDRVVEMHLYGIKRTRFRIIMEFLSWVVLLLAFCAFVPVPDSVGVYRDNFYYGLKGAVGISPYDVPPTELELRWNRFKNAEVFSDKLPGYNEPELQWQYNLILFARLERLENRMDGLEAAMKLQNESMSYLEEMLPTHISVREIDSQWEIPQHFWEALKEKLAEDSEMSSVWAAYSSQNQRQVDSIFRNSANQEIDRALENARIISRENFIASIKENNDWLVDKYSMDFKRMWEQNFDLVKEVSARIAGEVLAKSPINAYSEKQLQILVKANQIHDAYESITMLNWFSVGLGARIDPYLTSPTQQAPSRSWLQTVYLKTSPLITPPNPPITALQRWDEATDCWCAAKSSNGTTQITIQLNTMIFPDKLMVEHIPASATLNIAAAPRDLEIWVELESVEEANRIQRIQNENSHTLLDHRPNNPPSSKHILLGMGRYEIHTFLHVQTFKMMLDTKEIGIRTDKITVRTTSNWGADWTCFYRLRMTGDRADLPETLESAF